MKLNIFTYWLRYIWMQVVAPISQFFREKQREKSLTKYTAPKLPWPISLRSVKNFSGSSLQKSSATSGSFRLPARTLDGMASAWWAWKRHTGWASVVWKDYKHLYWKYEPKRKYGVGCFFLFVLNNDAVNEISKNQYLAVYCNHISTTMMQYMCINLFKTWN